MAKRTTPKKQVIGYRLDVYNPQASKRNDVTKWLTPAFSFNTRLEANEYRLRHYPDATKFRIYAVRFSASLDIPENFYFNNLFKTNKETQDKNGTTKKHPPTVS